MEQMFFSEPAPGWETAKHLGEVEPKPQNFTGRLRLYATYITNNTQGKQ